MLKNTLTDSHLLTTVFWFTTYLPTCKTKSLTYSGMPSEVSVLVLVAGGRQRRLSCYGVLAKASRFLQRREPCPPPVWDFLTSE